MFDSGFKKIAAEADVKTKIKEEKAKTKKTLVKKTVVKKVEPKIKANDDFENEVDSDFDSESDSD